MSDNPRQLAFLALRAVQRGAFADVALDKVLRQASLSAPDRRLFTELVYGCIRRQRTLDVLIDQLGKRPSDQQPPDLRLVLQIGLYQLRYLNQIPASAAVNTTVELAKQNRLGGLTGVVNGLLRNYIRLATTADPLQVPDDRVERIAIAQSYPSWIVHLWQEQFGLEATEQLCDWMNQPPPIDLRVNPLRASLEQVEAAMQAAGVAVQRVPPLPQALRLVEHAGSIQALPGFQEGWWVVQDSAAQLVGHVVNPQPGETILDACAAPGGKTTHLAELMGDRGTIWAIDKTPSRLNKLRQNCDRLGLTSIQIQTGDSRNLPAFQGQCDRVLLDVPCSGLGTLHRHADARWRQTPTTVQELVRLQAELLAAATTWVKPEGLLVYATCTLNPAENEQQITAFLAERPDWAIVPLPPNSFLMPFVEPEGWLKVRPFEVAMDGFFIVQLKPR